MFRNWDIKYFKGGYLASCGILVTKWTALKFLKNNDVYCIEKVRGLFKGQRIYKYKKV